MLVWWCSCDGLTFCDGDSNDGDGGGDGAGMVWVYGVYFVKPLVRKSMHARICHHAYVH